MARESEGVKTEIAPSVVQRVSRGIRYIVTGRGDWFGPGQPQRPAAQEQTEGRRFDFRPGQNLSARPRGGELIGFEQLRALAESFDLVRLAIETRKDQLAKLSWGIQYRMRPGQNTRRRPDDQTHGIEQFFYRPDKVHAWDTWLRMLLEDLFVLDAPTLYVRKALSGHLWGLEVVDGATIQPLIDEAGRPPMPPSPAYQQVLHGVAAAQYSAEELIYLPRNPRSHKIYGHGPVEQIITMINIALRRQTHQLNYYTDGNIPEALISVPEAWTAADIASFQAMWDELMEGDLAARRHARFIPGGVQPHFTREPELKGEYDEWIARVVMYAFSLPPLPFVREQNRATANTAQEAAVDEGLAPLMQWVKGLIDHVLAAHFDQPDMEFVWRDAKELDPATQSAIDGNDVRSGLKSIDEVRVNRGEEPLGIGHAIFGVGPFGVIFLDDLKDPEVRAAMKNWLVQQGSGGGLAGMLGGGGDLLGGAGDRDPLADLDPALAEALGIGDLAERDRQQAALKQQRPPQLEPPRSEMAPEVRENLGIGQEDEEGIARLPGIEREQAELETARRRAARGEPTLPSRTRAALGATRRP